MPDGQEQQPINISLFINFIGSVNPRTIGQLIQYIHTYSRPLHKQGVGWIQTNQIYLLIDSNGGILELANSVYEFVKALPNEIPITTYNIGIVDSAAVILFCLGKERYTMPNSRFIIHEATLKIEGELKRAKESVKGVEDTSKKAISIIAKVCKKSVRTVTKDIAQHKYFTPKEAAEYGLINGTRKSLPAPSRNDDVITITG